MGIMIFSKYHRGEVLQQYRVGNAEASTILGDGVDYLSPIRNSTLIWLPKEQITSWK